jgi:hypothetical protein
MPPAIQDRPHGTSLNPKTYLLAAVLLPAALRADHPDFVVISASASKTYTEQKFVAGVPQRQTYALFQGKFFDGQTRDPSIDRATFAAIAKILAPDLAKQNYLPASAAPVADLLIVVSWGTTATDPTLDKNFQSITDVKGNDSYMADALANSEATPMTFNSRLLGYDRALQQEGKMNWATPSGMNDIEESHLSQLLDERYVVILLAYDYQKMLRESRAYQALRNAASPREARRLVRPQPRPVWSVRMNIRAAGNNFNEALPAMSQAAAGYFGKQVDDLVDLPAAVGVHAHVEVGPTRVMGPVK